MKASIIRRVCLLAALVAIVGFWMTGDRAAADGPAAPVAAQSAAVDVDPAAPAGIPAAPAPAADASADVWSPSSMACGDRRCNGALECCWYQACRNHRCVAW